MTETTQKTLILIRNFLYRWFVVGFAFMFISAICFIFKKDFAVQMMQSLYGVSPEAFYNIVFIHFAVMKTFLILFVLSPALALHWLTCCCGCKK